MHRRAAILIGAALLALFHILVVVVPVLSSHANGEGQMWIVILFDLPLDVVLHFIPGAAAWRSDKLGYILTYCVGGTLMYACIGAFIGWIIDRFRHRSSPA